MNAVSSSLTYVNETDIRGRALLDLILQYASTDGAYNLSGYYGFRPMGAAEPNVVFPCVMIDPQSTDAKMDRLGKYRLTIAYNIYFYCIESSPEAVVSLADSIGEYLMKLFSNNALADGTPKFKQYPNGSGGYYWLDSEMTPVTWSTTFTNAEPSNQQNYMRAGIMKFTITDIILK